jgi:putative transposase
VLIPYRRFRIFIRDDIKTAADRTFREVAKDHKINIFELDIEEEHVHLFIGLHPSMSIATAYQILKGATARKLRQLFPELKGFHRRHLWSRGKCYRPISDVSPRTIKYYIRTSQSKHKKEPPRRTMAPIVPRPKVLPQTSLLDFTF